MVRGGGVCVIVCGSGGGHVGIDDDDDDDRHENQEHWVREKRAAWYQERLSADTSQEW